METISIIVPCYNEEKALPFFYNELVRVAGLMEPEFEIIFVDDGSQDGTLELVKSYAQADKRVKYLSLSRNFGKESVMYAGLHHATGDYAAIMDADLQDPPELLMDMYRALTEEGYDCAATRRVTRAGEPPIRSFFARMFYRLINKISQTEVVDGARDFRLMRRQMVDAVLEVPESNRFSKGLFSWVGFKTKWFEYENIERVAGETKWSFWKLFKYSIDGIVAYSTVPLVLAIILGAIFCMLSGVALIALLVTYLVTGQAMNVALMISVIFLVSGIQLFCVGILGQYLDKTYLETKNRPKYVLRETNIEQKER